MMVVKRAAAWAVAAALLFVVIFGDMPIRKHVLVQNANNSNAIITSPIEDDVTALPHTAHAGQQVVTRVPNHGAVGKTLAASFDGGNVALGLDRIPPMHRKRDDVVHVRFGAT
jgi:hypothetical protein